MEQQTYHRTVKELYPDDMYTSGPMYSLVVLHINVGLVDEESLFAAPQPHNLAQIYSQQNPNNSHAARLTDTCVDTPCQRQHSRSYKTDYVEKHVARQWVQHGVTGTARCALLYIRSSASPDSQFPLGTAVLGYLWWTGAEETQGKHLRLLTLRLHLHSGAPGGLGC